MEQPPNQLVEGQAAIGQFFVLDRTGEDGDVRPFRMVVAGVETLAPLLAFGQMLDHHAARDPALRVTRNGETNE